MRRITFLLLISLLMNGCSNGKRVENNPEESRQVHFLWENANVYFLLTDRFVNGEPSNDLNFDRTKETGKLRGFMGGDIRGVINKIKEGYFDDLGITAIWITPFFDQIRGGTDEGTGFTYAYHGYWTTDWTDLDPNFGTQDDLAEFVSIAHAHGIRVLMDVIINHTGPVTEKDPVWPSDWVRTEPQCTFKDYKSVVTCTLVKNLPDIKTESKKNVELPESLVNKWKKEGRYKKEMAELDQFFELTGYPRAPRYYLIKWLIDYIKKYGIDGYRLDTAKHVEESVWAELKKEAQAAFEAWKKANPDKVLDGNEFIMIGEVYNYNASGGKYFDFGDRKVDYFNYGIDGLINCGYKSDAEKSYSELFAQYNKILQDSLKGQIILNYISSHDDSAPYDKYRKKPLEAGTKLLLTQGASQVYYGDETGRSLNIEGTEGDATLRSFMNWEELENNRSINGIPAQEILSHYQKLGTFRKNHPAVGAGTGSVISETPLVISRVYDSEDYPDRVIIGLELDPGKKVLEVSKIFEDGEQLLDYYSGESARVKNGQVIIDSDYDIVLLGKS